MTQEFTVGRGFGKLPLTEAVEQAQADDIIWVEPGEYTINDRITLKGARLIGAGKNATEVVINGSLSSNKSTKISKLTINCTIENNALWIGTGITMQVTECIIRGTQYPSVAVKGATAIFERCQLEAGSEKTGLYALEQASVKVSDGIIQGLSAENQTTVSLETCQLSHRILAEDNSIVEGTDIYFTEPSWYGVLYATSGSQIKLESVELASETNTLVAEHGLIQVGADNTEFEHTVTYEQDDYSTVEFPNAVEKVVATVQSTEAQETATEEVVEEEVEETTEEAAEEEIIETEIDEDTEAETELTGTLAELHQMIGLNNVKETVDQIVSFQAYNQKRLREGKKALSQGLHAVFLGNPGTGKTTVARMFGRLMYEQGILPKETFKEVNEQDLISSNMGQTSERTQAVLEAADGGVLFIDEAYTLYKENYRQQGQEAIDTILKFMEDHRDSLMIIFAGYTKEMQDLLDSNPGLRSRIPNVFDFEDYTGDEIAQMGTEILEYDQFKFNHEYYKIAVKKAYKQSIDHSNGRWVRNYNEKLEKIAAERAMKAHSDEYDIIINEDIDQLLGGNQAEKAVEVDRLLAKLNHLIGLDDVKQYVSDLVDQVKLDKKMGDNLPENRPTYHMIFAGPPGTGKTTVAKIISELFYNLDILPSKTIINTDRQALVGRYIGQSEKNTGKILRDAMGGVLFVDEAYQLSQGGENDFGKQVIETMLPVLEDERDKFIAIFAGYTDKMNEFLNTNPGLKSRVPLQLNFEAYTPEQVGQIVELYLGDHWQFNHELVKEIATANYRMLAKADQGNARWARTFTDSLIQKHKVWMAQQTEIEAPTQINDDIIQAMSTVSGDSAQEKEQIVTAILTEIDNMVGMNSVKKFVHDLVRQVQVEHKMADQLGQSQATYHMIFTGPAGTGKTTVARMIAKLFYALDILPRQTVKEVTRTDLVGQYIGQTEKQTQAVIDDAMGGVLFVDEAYQLSQGVGNGNNFGQAAVETMLTNLENHRTEFVAIFAGYTDEMNHFLDMNTGLRSRIPLTLEFESYTAEQIGIIADQNLAVDWEYNHELVQKIAAQNYQRLPKKEQGNARWARTFSEQIVQKQKQWLGEQDSVTTPHQINDDIIRAMSSTEGAGAENKGQIVEAVLTELDGMIGLDAEKKFVHKLVDRVKVNRVLNTKLGNQPQTSYHMIFTGPAGTGKTTVARMIAKLFYALDILPRQTVKEVTRTDLVGQYIGHTEKQTQAVIDDALGGVLFVDEAYQLSQGGGNGNDFGQAAVETMLTNLENHRTEFVAIFAGYTDEMNHFLDMNEGLRSRIPITLEFNPYSPDAVAQIVDQILAKTWQYNHELLIQKIIQCYAELPANEQGNARTARNFATTIDNAQRDYLVNHLDSDNPLMIENQTLQDIAL